MVLTDVSKLSREMRGVGNRGPPGAKSFMLKTSTTPTLDLQRNN